MKINKKGFVLAETLVVTVFVMLIFTIIYANFYPIMGKYQEREYFDDIDSKYNTYWLKRFFQDSDIIDEYAWAIVKEHIKLNGGYEFYCMHNNCPLIREEANRNLVEGFVGSTNSVHIFITKYNLEKTDHVAGENVGVQFKGKTGDTYLKKFDTQDKVDTFNTFWLPNCNRNTDECKKLLNEKMIPNLNGVEKGDNDPELNHYHVYKPVNSLTKRYIEYLPAYKFPSTRHAKYRIIAEYTRVEDEGKQNQTKIHTFSTIELKRD